MSAARLRGAVLVLACVATLAGCGGGDDVSASTDPVEVEVGKGFSWNSFVVEDGWEINGIERSADGDAVATLNCSARKMVEGQSQEFICPGLNTTMPEDYDAVVVQELTR